MPESIESQEQSGGWCETVVFRPGRQYQLRTANGEVLDLEYLCHFHANGKVFHEFAKATGHEGAPFMFIEPHIANHTLGHFFERPSSRLAA